MLREWRLWGQSQAWLMRTPPPGQEEVDKACSRRLLTAGAAGEQAGQREGVGQVFCLVSLVQNPRPVRVRNNQRSLGESQSSTTRALVSIWDNRRILAPSPEAAAAVG